MQERVTAEQAREALVKTGHRSLSVAMKAVEKITTFISQAEADGAELERCREAMLACVATHYVGDGKVVCTTSLKPHLDAFARILGKP